MKSVSKALPLVLGLAAGLALVLTSAAEAAKARQHKRHSAAMVAQKRGYWNQQGVPAGPLYNGLDYLGTDPDPNIRSQILRDLGSRYGSPD